ncbi:hypothetical protein RYH80_08405 [Halobaculum sp. MBLA0147]|uniref:hypothetical protein n=1 Tax=Halobaculum sp. MBLA0147 TaxID=3079934 RepID=UPI003523653E
MRRRTLLRRTGQFGALAVGGAGLAAASDGDYSHVVYETEAGDREVVPVAEFRDRDGPARAACDEIECTVYDCDDCPESCYDTCGGCLCSSP